MKTQHTAFWAVALSNGETIHEEKGDYKTIEGAASPWQRLQSYIAANNLTITALWIYTEGGRTYHIPSAGDAPKFRAFAEAPKPVELTMFRQMAGDIMGGQVVDPDLFTVAEATYLDGKKIQLWVDNRTRNCWTLMV